MNHRIRVNALFLLAVFLCLPLTTSAATLQDTCPDQYNASQAAVIFDPTQETADYSPDGYLIYHLHLVNPSADGDSFNLRLNYSNDHCEGELRHSDWSLITLTAGASDISIRFTSLLTYDIWDDTHNVLLKQVGPADTTVPLYTSVTPIAAPTSFASIYTGHTYHIKEGSAPPLFENKVTKPSICPEHDMSGFLPIDLGDARAEYVDHLLRIHLRFSGNYYPSAGFERNPSFGAAVVPAGDDCSFGTESVFSLPNVTTPHNVWYFSVRSTSPTHWVLWDDEISE